MGQRVDHHRAVLDPVRCADPECAAACLIKRSQFLGGRDDLGLGGKIRPFDVLAEISNRCLWRVQQMNCCRHHFVQIVGGDIGGHADCNASGTVQQQVRYLRRQHGRLLEGAVEIRLPVHRALTQLRQEHLSVRGQTRLRVAHSGEGFGVIGRAPVTLTVDKRIAIAEVLRHQYHRFISRTVAVRMELTDDVTHCTSGLLVLGRRLQAQLTHGVNDAPLDRFQAIANMGKRAVQDHVH